MQEPVRSERQDTTSNAPGANPHWINSISHIRDCGANLARRPQGKLRDTYKLPANSGDGSVGVEGSLGMFRAAPDARVLIGAYRRPTSNHTL